MFKKLLSGAVLTAYLLTSGCTGGGSGASGGGSSVLLNDPRAKVMYSPTDGKIEFDENNIHKGTYVHYEDFADLVNEIYKNEFSSNIPNSWKIVETTPSELSKITGKNALGCADFETSTICITNESCHSSPYLSILAHEIGHLRTPRKEMNYLEEAKAYSGGGVLVEAIEQINPEICKFINQGDSTVLILNSDKSAIGNLISKIDLDEEHSKGRKLISLTYLNESCCNFPIDPKSIYDEIVNTPSPQLDLIYKNAEQMSLSDILYQYIDSELKKPFSIDCISVKVKNTIFEKGLEGFIDYSKFMENSGCYQVNGQSLSNIDKKTSTFINYLESFQTLHPNSEYIIDLIEEYQTGSLNEFKQEMDLSKTEYQTRFKGIIDSIRQSNSRYLTPYLLNQLEFWEKLDGI